MSRSESPQDAYRRLLREHGYAPPALEEWVKTGHRLSEEARVSANAEGIMNEGAPMSEPAALFLPGAFIDGTPPMNALIAPLAKELERAAGEWSLAHPRPLHVGVFPTGEFNALATPAGDGVLLLINEGLMYFAYQSMETFGLSTTIVFGDKHIGPVMSKDEATGQLADVVYSYLSKGSSASARHLPMTGGLRGSYVNHLATSIHRFVVAHEYGHAYARHLGSTSTMRLSLPSGELEVINKNWEQELEADLVAMRLMVPPSVRKVRRDSGRAVLHLAMALVGPLAFFQLDMLLEAAERACSGRVDPSCINYSSSLSTARQARARVGDTDSR